MNVRAIMVLAEVMDKEPAPYALLLGGLGIGLAAFFAVRFSLWMLFLAVPVAWIAAAGLTSEIRDRFVGPAILREAGYSYVFVGYVAASIPFVACIAGLIYHRRRRARATQTI